MLTFHRQLLYQPFMPYFVVFANIISNPRNNWCFKDLQLLRQVVLYFLQMHNNHQSAKKLEKVAETFTRLAEAYVRHSMQQSSDGPCILDAQKLGERNQPLPSDPTNALLEGPLILQVESSHDIEIDSSQASMASLTNRSDSQNTFNFDDLGSDPITLLNFFSAPGFDDSSAVDFATDLNTESHPLYLDGRTGSPLDAGQPSQPLIRELENIAHSNGLDGTFDWFSWDQYERAMS
jgi:hypothetical protein